MKAKKIYGLVFGLIAVQIAIKIGRPLLEVAARMKATLPKEK